MAKKIISFIITLMLCIQCLPSSARDAFEDVDPSMYCYEAVHHMREKGIINGYEDGTFRPDSHISRAEMATLVCKMYSEEKPLDKKGSFSDVSPGHWASTYINHASALGIISGDGSGMFRPEDKVTYEEAIKMTIMATGLGNAVVPYTSDWSKAYIELAGATGISHNLKGHKGEKATRADVAVMMSNAIKLKEDGKICLYSRSLYNTEQNIPLDVCFALSDDDFLTKDYSSELSKASLVLSMTAYDYIKTQKPTKGNADAVMKDLGFEDICHIELEDLYDDNNITSFYIGNKEIVSAGKSYRLMGVAIRGTDGTLKEWTSNMDIGSGLENENYTKKNHKGYDITSQRVLVEMQKYIQAHSSPEKQNIIWLSGHSRGGSIANLCAAKLADSGESYVAYTFGASLTTTDAKATSYNSIYNIVNEDDLVTCLPMSQWGFVSYGKTARLSVSENLKDIWTETTGLNKYKAKKNIKSTTDTIATCSSGRAGCYEYPTDGKLCIEVQSKEEGLQYADRLRASLAKSSLDYCSFKIVEAKPGSAYPYVLEMHMQPAYLMHNVAAVLSGNMSALSYLTLPVANYLVPAHNALVAAYAGGLTHPHTPETYYAMTKVVTGGDFIE